MTDNKLLPWRKLPRDVITNFNLLFIAGRLPLERRHQVFTLILALYCGADDAGFVDLSDLAFFSYTCLMKEEELVDLLYRFLDRQIIEEVVVDDAVFYKITDWIDPYPGRMSPSEKQAAYRARLAEKKMSDKRAFSGSRGKKEDSVKKRQSKAAESLEDKAVQGRVKNTGAPYTSLDKKRVQSRADWEAEDAEPFDENEEIYETACRLSDTEILALFEKLEKQEAESKSFKPESLEETGVKPEFEDAEGGTLKACSPPAVLSAPPEPDFSAGCAPPLSAPDFFAQYAPPAAAALPRVTDALPFGNAQGNASVTNVTLLPLRRKKIEEREIEEREIEEREKEKEDREEREDTHAEKESGKEKKLQEERAEGEKEDRETRREPAQEKDAHTEKKEKEAEKKRVCFGVLWKFFSNKNPMGFVDEGKELLACAELAKRVVKLEDAKNGAEIIACQFTNAFNRLLRKGGYFESMPCTPQMLLKPGNYSKVFYSAARILHPKNQGGEHWAEELKKAMEVRT